MDESIEHLVELFREFPGIGGKQARRFVYFLIRKDRAYTQELLDAIARVKREVGQCSSCLRYGAKIEGGTCSLCQQRSGEQLMLVERDADLENIERTKLYTGKYFVLRNMPTLGKQVSTEVRYGLLVQRIEKGIEEEGLSELIFALSLRPESEHERIILTRFLRERFPRLTISTLGRGLSSGIELEYSDEETLRHAIARRERIE